MPTQRESEVGFTTALHIQTQIAETAKLSSGIQQLDELLGDIKPPHLYVFYGEDDTPDQLLLRLTVEAVKTGGHVIYILCGDYRRDRTSLNVETLIWLLESKALDVEDALRRIHLVAAFSESQLLNTPRLAEALMETHNVRLLVIQQISKLFYSESAHGLEDRAEFKRVVSRLRESCASHSVALAASCRAKRRRGLNPEPRGGSYLRHSAAVLVYLRGREEGVASAVLVKHFDRRRVGRRINFIRGEKGLGRIIGSSTRKRIQDSMRLLRSMYREALKSDELQEAFDEVWRCWSEEEGAMVYTEVASALDLINLTGVVANRREIRRLRARIDALEANGAG